MTKPVIKHKKRGISDGVIIFIGIAVAIAIGTGIYLYSQKSTAAIAASKSQTMENGKTVGEMFDNPGDSLKEIANPTGASSESQ